MPLDRQQYLPLQEDEVESRNLCPPLLKYERKQLHMHLFQAFQCDDRSTYTSPSLTCVCISSQSWFNWKLQTQKLIGRISHWICEVHFIILSRENHRMYIQTRSSVWNDNNIHNLPILFPSSSNLRADAVANIKFQVILKLR